MTRLARAMDREAALAAVRAAVGRSQMDRTPVVIALDVLASADADEEVADAVLALGEAIIDGAFGDRLQFDVLDRCLAVLSRVPDRKALRFHRAATEVSVATPRLDLACTVRARALMALHALEPDEARYVATRLLEVRAPSGEPALAALAVLGAGGDDVALLLACHTVLRGDVPLTIAALEQLSSNVPPSEFWKVAAPIVGDRFSDAVLAITDIVVGSRRSDLVPGFGAALVEVSDPDLMRAVLLALVGARLDGLELAFAAVVEGAPRRALEGAADALEMARFPAQEELMRRVTQRLRGPASAEAEPGARERPTYRDDDSAEYEVE